MGNNLKGKKILMLVFEFLSLLVCEFSLDSNFSLFFLYSSFFILHSSFFISPSLTHSFDSTETPSLRYISSEPSFESRRGLVIETTSPRQQVKS